MTYRSLGATLALTTALAAAAQAQAPDTATLRPVEATGKQTRGYGTDPDAPPFSSAVPDNIPASVEERTARQISEQNNAVTVAEMLKYLPSVEVRERYIGDRNGIVATRTTGTVSSAEALVYADDMLISNLLGNSYSWPPRWGLVPIPTIAKIDMMYGPFSALYPGNSMGGVITITTRMPETLEAHVEATGLLEHFNLYDVRQNNGGGHFTAAVGDRIGPWSFWISLDHLQAAGHPMSFATAEIPATTSTAGTKVNGAVLYNDTSGKPAYLFGAYSIDHTLQDMGTVKVAYDFDPERRLSLTLGLWSNLSDTSVQSFVTSAATGAPLYNGTFNVNGRSYSVTSVDPTISRELHLATGASYKTDTRGTWDVDFSISSYTFLYDKLLSSSAYGVTNAGTDQHQDGTGWVTADARAIYRPGAALWGQHELSFGAHIDQFHLEQKTYTEAAWESGSDGALNALSEGTTLTSALYVQDYWKLADRWSLTLGLRGEGWDASGGANTNAKGTFGYPARSQYSLSPKASGAYQIDQSTELRLSFGQAYRYPTVTELFQQVSNNAGVIVGDPALKPEEVLSTELALEKALGRTSVRVALFDEERKDALFSQTDTTVTPNVTQVENITKARTYGAEVSGDAPDLFVHGLDFNGSLTWSPSQVLQDSQAPGAVGRIYPRIPLWRARAVLTYHLNDDWVFSAGVRAASAAYSTLLNTDVNHQVYGGISSYLVGDLRLTHKLDQGVSLIAGVDNVGNFKYYVSPHPYPQTTGFLTVKWDL